MGEFRLKVNFGFFKKLLYTLLALACIGLGIFIYIKVKDNAQGNMLNTFMVYVSIGFWVMALIIFIMLYVVSSRVKLELYENGINVMGRVEPIMYRDCESFFFVPTNNDDIKAVAIKARYDTPVFSGNYLGEDFFKYIQKDFKSANLDEFENRLRAGDSMSFGIYTTVDMAFSVFKSSTAFSKFNFKRKVTLKNDALIYEGIEYPYSQISPSYDTKTGEISIDKLSGEKIFSNNYTRYEMGDTFFFLLSRFMKDQSTSKTHYMLAYEPPQIITTDSEVIDETIIMPDQAQSAVDTDVNNTSDILQADPSINSASDETGTADDKDNTNKDDEKGFFKNFFNN